MRKLFWIAALMLAVSGPGALCQGKADAKVNPALKNPSALKDKAPATYRAKFQTTKGVFIVEVKRAWAPLGADQFYNLVKYGYFDHVKFFRVIPGFVAQFGMHGDPAISAKWRDANIQDEKVVTGNKRGYLTFAKSSAPNSRTTQLFINLVDNPRLDEMGFSAFGHVVQGMDVVDKLYSGYGALPDQEQPDQRQIAERGNSYLEKEFPKLDSVEKATLVK